jgi:hypothetical protein
MPSGSLIVSFGMALTYSLNMVIRVFLARAGEKMETFISNPCRFWRELERTRRWFFHFEFACWIVAKRAHRKVRKDE